MANMLYNGVELPNIDSVWTNKVTYPYAVIVYYYSAWYELYLTTDVATVTSTAFKRAGGAVYKFTTGTSSEWEYQNTTGSSSGPLGANMINLVWSNHDILNSDDNSVYLAASDPVDPNAPTEPELTEEERLKWFLLGKLLRRNLMAGVKEATMYSYNGVVLPKLPEWDKTVYPYAVMYTTQWTDNTVFLCCCSDLSQNGDTITLTTPSVQLMHDPDNADSMGYWYWGNVQNNWNDVTADKTLTYGYLLWTNKDILNEDGTVYLAASEPIPIYE